MVWEIEKVPAQEKLNLSGKKIDSIFAEDTHQ